jgi:hypothetical protein
MKYFLAFIRTPKSDGFYELVRSGNLRQARTIVERNYPDAYEVEVNKALEL